MGRMASETRRLYLGLAVPHVVLSTAWFLCGLIWQNRVVWFASGTLVPFYLATGLLILARHMWRTLPYLAWGVAVLDALSFVPVGFYAANIITAYTGPGDSPDATTRALANQLWNNEPGLPILALSLLGAMAVLQLATIVALAVWGRRWREVMDEERDEAARRGTLLPVVSPSADAGAAPPPSLQHMAAALRAWAGAADTWAQRH